MFAGLCALLAVFAQPVAGQVIRGTVVDSTTGQPVGTGFVVLLDERGNEVVRALTTPTGAFEVRPFREGSFRIRSERIGYRPWESELIHLSLRQTVEYVARVTALPVQLATIEVREETSCRMRDEQSRAVSVLWEEARKALAAASWNAEQNLYRQTLLSYERDLDESRRRVVNENTRVASGLYQVPYRGVDPQVLSSRGYVTDDDHGDTWYYAPDADVLLDDGFHSLHCFKVVEGTGDNEGLIGLGFEPIGSQRQTDVRGTLWIDRESAELRELNYSYTRLPGGITDDRIGGSVEFLPMPSGAWIVHRWQIRTPRMVSDRGRVFVGGFRDTGGEILVVTTVEGDSVYSAPMAHLAGTVVDSSQGDFPVPLRGVLVTVVGTSFSTVTSGNGSFRLDAPLTGTYGISFSHPRMDSIGIAAPELDVELEPGSGVEVHVGFPSMATMLERHCDGGWSRGLRVLVGVVRDRLAEPVSNAAVQAVWQIINIHGGDVITANGRDRATRADRNGRFALCNLPEGPVITVRGRAERLDVVIDGAFKFSFAQGRSEVEIIRPDETVDRVFAPYIIWKADLSLFPN